MQNTLSRRNFLRLTGTFAAAMPILTEANLALAQRPMTSRHDQPGGIRIDANENPLGPSSEACRTISSLIPEGGRYNFDLTQKLIDTFCRQEDLKPEYLQVYCGSSEPLHYSVLAFTSKNRPYVTADPGYEAGMYAATMNGAQIVKVPLTSTHAHDVRAMVKAAPNGGLYYICNPNNPTGTITPREEIEWMLANKPAGSILLVDEAYIHFSDEPSVLDLVRAGKDLIVLRTFSKLYGMAGMRCGFAAGRPDLVARLNTYSANSLPIMAVAAAAVSLEQPGLVPERKKINSSTRAATFEWLAANNYSFIPSVSNCFMLDTRRDGKQVGAAMAKQGVYIGRVWPVMPTWVRITVGTSSEMQRFQEAFKQVMQSDLAEFDPMDVPAGLRNTPFTHLA